MKFIVQHTDKPCREGHYTQVRLAAFDGLFLTKWYTPVIMRYILSVIANDPSRIVRRHVARNACHSLALLVQMGEMKSNLKDTESLLIEEDGNAPEKAKESKKSELDLMIKVLRKDREIGKNEAMREFLMPIALCVLQCIRLFLPLLKSCSAPDIDYEVRWCLLKLADILIRPVEEVPPSVKIHIPSTPITDIAPPIPPVKVPVKPTRTLKSGGSSSRHPTVQLNISAARAGILGSPQSTPAELPMSSPVIKKGVLLAPPVPPVPPTATSSSKPKMKLNARLLSNRANDKSSAKPTQTLKAQSAGMTINDLRACRNALRKLQSNRHALLFKQPVDPIRDSAPRYVDNSGPDGWSGTNCRQIFRYR